MSVAVLGVPESPRSATLQGRELIEGRRRLDVAEAEWLLSLAGFDLLGVWSEDGHSSCVAWLVERCGMARRTAIEKLRVAKELDRRPALAAALESGDVSYAKTRSISRYNGANPGVEAELIASAAELTNEELERAVRYARGLHEQDKDPAGRYDRRGVSRCYGVVGGMGRLIIDGPDDDIERIANLLDAQTDADRRAASRTVRSGNADDHGVRSGNADDHGVRSGNADDHGVRSGNADDHGVRSGNADDHGVRSGNAEGDAVRSGNADDHGVRSGNADEVEAGEAEEQSPEDPAARTTIVQRRYDALVDLVEFGAAHQHDAIDVERAAIGVTIDYQTLVERAPGHADLASGVTLTAKQCAASPVTAASTASSSKAPPRSLMSARKPANGTGPNAAPSRRATATNAPSAAAAGASWRSTTSKPGKTAARPLSATAYLCASPTTTSSTKAAGPSPTTLPPAHHPHRTRRPNHPQPNPTTSRVNNTNPGRMPPTHATTEWVVRRTLDPCRIAISPA